MRIDVVIAVRNEPDLHNTIASIAKHTPGASARIVEDHQGEGCMLMRHRGIAASDADVVACMDGHMRLRDDSLVRAAEYVRGTNRVVCLRCQHGEPEWNGTVYAGAWMQERTENRGQYSALGGKWRSNDTAGPIGCLMGACYVMDRQWYMDGICQPWRWGTGWGQDEEVLSLTTYRMGGSVELFDGIVWHQYQHKGRYQNTDWQDAGVWAQKFKTLHIVCDEPEVRQSYTDWINKTGFNGPKARMITQICRRTEGEIANWRDGMKWERTWAQTYGAVVGKQEVGTVTKSDLYQKAKKIGCDVEWKMSRSDIERILMITQLKRREPIPDIPKEPKPDKYKPLIAVEDPGIPCHACGNRYGHTVQNSNYNGTGNRRMKCGSCSRIFMAYRK